VATIRPPLSTMNASTWRFHRDPLLSDLRARFGPQAEGRFETEEVRAITTSAPDAVVYKKIFQVGRTEVES